MKNTHRKYYIHVGRGRFCFSPPPPVNCETRDYKSDKKWAWNNLVNNCSLLNLFFTWFICYIEKVNKTITKLWTVWTFVRQMGQEFRLYQFWSVKKPLYRFSANQIYIFIVILTFYIILSMKIRQLLGWAEFCFVLFFFFVFRNLHATRSNSCEISSKGCGNYFSLPTW